ncbi:hypothetical protein MRY16398_31380 [Phytobacter sp. MRY16-398]|nr:hypothetical protein MRY16398_31380 [Phytobacter sp. MRY16-398]
MKVVFLCIAIVMQFQINGSDMTCTLDMNTVATVFHLNLSEEDIVTTGMLAGCRVARAVKEYADVIVTQILTLRILVNRSDNFNVLDTDIADIR